MLRAGVVVARKEGSTVIYSIASPDIAELLAVARKVLTTVLSDRVAVLEDLRADRRLRRTSASGMGWICEDPPSRPGHGTRRPRAATG